MAGFPLAVSAVSVVAEQNRIVRLLERRVASMTRIAVPGFPTRRRDGTRGPGLSDGACRLWLTVAAADMGTMRLCCARGAAGA